MAIDGNDPPPLPKTDDPFVLLGVPPDADAKALRQAYAKLIRLYRPDCSPTQFQRVHAAYEDAKQRLAGDADAAALAKLVRAARAAEPAPEPVSEAEPEPLEPDGDHGSHDVEAEAKLTELKRRVKANDTAGVAALLDELLGDRIPLDLIVDDGALSAALVRLPSLSWTRLAKTGSDPDVVYRIWSRACDEALLRDPARGSALIDDPALRLDAADDPQLAVGVLLRIAALAWRQPESPEPLFETYRQAIPPHPQLDSLFDSVGIDLEAARAVAGRPFREPLKALPELFAFARNGNGTQRREVADAMLRALAVDVRRGIDRLAILTRHREFRPIFELLFLHLDPSSRHLDNLPKPAFDRLTARLHAAGREPYKMRVAAAVVAVAAVCTVFSPMIGLAIIGGLALVFLGFLATEQWRYLHRVRPAIAEVMLEVPVTSDVVTRWIRINGKLAGRLSRFDLAIDRDGPLGMFSLPQCRRALDRRRWRRLASLRPRGSDQMLRRDRSRFESTTR